ncbi:MAG: hypothetical protein ACW96X_02425 [Promethearchaeota archaeon]|jgi:hypothetical protein
MSNEITSEEKFWGKKLKEHWKALAIAIIGAIIAFIGAGFVLNSFMATSYIGAQGTATFDQWTLDWIVGFFIQYTGWTLLIIGIPSLLFFGLGGYLWWRSLPEEEKQEFKEREKKEKPRRKEKYGGGGGGGGGMFIAYLIYHLVNGTHKITFGSRSYRYWIDTWFETLIWLFIYVGIPVILILLIVYFAYWRKKSEE